MADSHALHCRASRARLVCRTHNYGTENDATFAYNNGNVEPHRGFGHVGFIVDDIEVWQALVVASCAGARVAACKLSYLAIAFLFSRCRHSARGWSRRACPSRSGSVTGP